MIETVAIAGFGRFGRALGELLLDAGATIRAFDPRGEVPADVRVDGPAALVRGAGFVVLAVPLPLTRAALAQLRPHLTAGHTVLDVGSVKVMPSEAMAELLGDAVPWVATHPLFGPTSLALGERPLRVVVCPNERHPAAVERVTALYRAIGCTPFFQEPDHHDRTMAYTHALTYFVTKGMLDIGVDRITEAPPSFRAMAQTIEAVRSDAGHLFSALHRENPYAPGARERLLAALAAVDRTLDEEEEIAIPVGLPHPAAGEPDHDEELDQIRDSIDGCDRELLALLERRARLAIRAGEVKATRGRQVRDPARERRLLSDRKSWATELGLDEEAVDDIFGAILRFSRRIQHVERSDGSKPSAAPDKRRDR
jgi:prephenate dehydrogenase